ncbi:hypothetical protein RHSP_50437 [Rhizobium freirei PRF 81]|uniref:Uncharacterized protein n=1 Tax=Rhizobium freirei PRF 81 TaxID=363754 RepID=N6UCV8_9HYPH|nr:hypothetical protein RHSP_50437 [Rhizobium freirei PRF 81]
MAHDRQPRADTLGLGGADEVLAHHLDHRAAHQPRDAGRMRQRQHDDWQDQEFDRAVAPAADRQPAERVAEDELKDRSDQEARHDQADEEPAAQPIVGRTVLIKRPETAYEHADDGCEHEGSAADGQRIGEAGHDLLGDGEILIGERGAKVALHDVADIDQVLLNQGLIEVVMSREVGFDFRRQWPFAIEGAAGSETQNEKAYRYGNPHDGDCRQQTTESIAKHGLRRLPPAFAREGGCSQLFFDRQPARAVDVLNVVDEALDLRGDDVLGNVVVDRDRGAIVEGQLLGLLVDLGALLQVGLLIALSDQCVVFRIAPAAVIHVDAGREQAEEVDRVVVVGEPAGTADLHFTALHSIVMHLGFGVVELNIDAERLPHGGDRDCNALVVVVGVVAKLCLQRMIGAEACFLQQLLGLFDLLLVGFVLPAHIGRFAVIGRTRRHPGIHRQLAGAEDLRTDDLAVDGHGESLTNALVVEGRLGGVQDVVIGAKERHHMRLAWKVLLKPFILIGGKRGDDIEFAGAIALQGGCLIFQCVEVHLVDLHVLGVIILIVLDVGDMRARHPLHRLIGAIGDDILDLDPLVALGFDDMLRQRIGRVVHQGVEEVGRRVLERDFQRLVVDCLDAQLAQILDLALVDLFRVLDRVLQVGVLGGSLRIHQALKCKDEILSGDRVAVGPLDAVAQLEGIDLLVGGNGPARSLARNGIVLGILSHQTFENIAVDAVLPIAGNLLRVERSRVAAIVDIEGRGMCGEAQYRADESRR